MRRAGLAALLVVAAALTACHASTTDAGGTSTSSVPPSHTTSRPPPATSAKPRPKPKPTPQRPVREIDGTCPYIATQDLADKVGSRVGRTTILTSTPRGCRFYLSFGDFHAVAQITVKTYPDALTAHNAMVRTAEKGSQPIGIPSLAPGTEGILYRTSFYPPDGDQDWACIFRKGHTVVTVKTDQNDTSFNAKQIAVAVSGKF
jgi:hypothetical protein